MRLPDQGASWNIAEPLHGGLQPQQRRTACTRDSPEKVLPDHPMRQQAFEAEEPGVAGEKQTQGMTAPEAMAEADQHRHQHPAGKRCPMLRVLHRHRVGDWVDLQSFFPRQNSKPDCGAHNGIDEQDDQLRMQQTRPGMET